MRVQSTQFSQSSGGFDIVVERAFAFFGVGQAIGAKILTAEVRLTELGRWMIAFQDELVVFERGSQEETVVENAEDKVVEAV